MCDLYYNMPPPLKVVTHLATPYYITLVRPTGIILPQGVFVDRIHDNCPSCPYFTTIKKKRSRKFLIKSWLVRNIMYIYICGYIGDVVVVECVCGCESNKFMRRIILCAFLMYSKKKIEKRE